MATILTAKFGGVVEVTNRIATTCNLSQRRLCLRYLSLSEWVLDARKIGNLHCHRKTVFATSVSRYCLRNVGRLLVNHMITNVEQSW